jgi:Regulated-SNARE-like domain
MVRIAIVTWWCRPYSRDPSRPNHSEQNPAEQFEADLYFRFLTFCRILRSDVSPLLADVWEQYLFHYVSEDGLTFMVMADDSVGRRMPFAFLAELQSQVPTPPPVF